MEFTMRKDIDEYSIEEQGIAQKTGHCQTIARVRNPIYAKEISFIKKRLGLN